VIESTLKKNKETHTPDATSKTKLEDAIPSEAQEHVANTVVHDELAESTPDSDVIYKKMENNTVNVTYTASTTKDPAPFSNGNGTRNEQVDMT
jgi:hypothetical protein